MNERRKKVRREAEEEAAWARGVREGDGVKEARCGAESIGKQASNLVYVT